MIHHGRYEPAEAETKERALRGLLAIGCELVYKLVDTHPGSAARAHALFKLQDWCRKTKEVLDE